MLRNVKTTVNPAESAESSTRTFVWQKIALSDDAAESAESAESQSMTKDVASFQATHKK